MREQPPAERVKNFNEVALGFTEEEALVEAGRCLNCKKPPCIGGCPVEIDIPAFIQLILKKDFEAALDKIREKNSLPAICGRVCPQEDQCEKVCILAKKKNPINIGALERFAADWGSQHASACSVERATSDPSASSGSSRAKSRDDERRATKIAVIGSGPAGLTCAGELAKMGYNVTVFESLHKPGGVLVYGIPEFRLPKNIVEAEVEYLKTLGVKVETNVLVGKTKTLPGLRRDGYRAFFIGIGAGLPYFMGIEGEIYNGIYSANEFLTRVNLMKSYLFPEYDTPVRVGARVGVIGAGNVAMDSARCAKRLGAKDVYIIYRRTDAEMPARQEEIERAKEEGIIFELLTNPVRFFGNEEDWLVEAECIRNKLGEPDSSGRRRPVPIKGSEFRMKLDTVICAIGQGPNPLLPRTLEDLKLNEDGNIVADGDGLTSMESVFAGGDIVTGADTVISAMGAGKKAARAIDRYLRSR
jgi:glutamate synthase (NADPH/NADH) small chain